MGLEQMVTRPHGAMVETFCSCLAAHSGSEPEWKKECGCTQHRLIGLGVIGVPPILCPKRLHLREGTWLCLQHLMGVSSLPGWPRGQRVWKVLWG